MATVPRVVCIRCDAEFPITSAWFSDREVTRAEAGLSVRCRDCERERKRHTPSGIRRSHRDVPAPVPVRPGPTTMDSPAPRPPVEPVRVVPLDDAAYVAVFAARLVTEHDRAIGYDRVRLAYAAAVAALPYVGLHDVGERLRGDALRQAVAAL